ncbi:MAG TPA: alpha-D-glucose phosphate-specific phosphoglucomutase [Microvirga sp.]|jgi:phosphoglucomutase|nr:alpha-D-glucose phosphate-specific phosphoglucomutase [Microvirga sp.]
MRVETVPFPDQKPGTSGLRKAVPVFRQPRYLENFVQAIFDTVPELAGGTMVLGGDGRFFMDEAVQIILRMASANGVARVLVGRGGLLSTPAASALIRARGAQGGIILSASHNPGGPEGDFGVKFNAANGGPAPASVTDAIFRNASAITRYNLAEGGAYDLSAPGEGRIGAMTVEVVDSVSQYVGMMERLFDFGRIQAMLRKTPVRFDAMNAVTGPYAQALFEDRLGAPPGTVLNGVPLPDFGGLHPDPNPVYAKALIDLMRADRDIAFGACSDGDGDRNLIIGPGGMVVSPSDSLAVLAANAHLAPGYAEGLKGVARSMPTSRAVDRVAAAMDLPLYETPTGWKFFGNLLDDGRITLCGEESAGTGSNHIREKDGLWAVMLWLDIVAARGLTVDRILKEHWRRFGRDYYARYDYEEIDTAAAEGVMNHLRAGIADLPGRAVGGLKVESADEFTYEDPVDRSVARGQGIRIYFRDGSRVVYRLSGTGTQGATLRIYLERYEADAARHGLDPNEVLSDLARVAADLAELPARTGRTAPSVIA